MSNETGSEEKNHSHQKANSSSRKKLQKRKLEMLLELSEVRSWRSLMGAYQSIYRQLERALLTENCSIPRFQILFYLYFEGPTTGVELSRKLFVTRGNISTFLRRLQADGILKKPEEGAKKRQLLQLTDHGKKTFEDLFPRHIDRVRSLMPPLDVKTLEKLRDTVDQISFLNLSKSK